jgi:threonine dehydrogenase-like Zn-dependent dehydrogenase
MKAAIWNDVASLDIIDVSKPDPRPGWVRLRVAACGVCGSDLHGFGRPEMAWSGMQPGHEISGYVDAVGEGVVHDHAGLMAVEPMHSCGHCASCDGGHHNLCADVELVGFGLPGGLAEFVEVPAHRLHALPENMALPVATLAEPLAVCVRAIRLSGLSFGQHVAVIGAGTIGLLTVAAARAGGASSVHVVARHPRQSELALVMGADATYATTEALLDAIGERFCDVVIETVGGWATTLIDAVSIAAPGATIVNVGCFEGNTPLPGPMFFAKELVLRASNCYAFDQGKSDFALAAGLLADLDTALAPLITHQFSLDDVVPAFETAGDKSSGSIKVQIQLDQ